MRISCLLCNSEDFHLLFPFKRYKILRCKNCRLVFVHPWPKKKDLEKLYKKYPHVDGFLHEQGIRRDARRTLQNVRKMGYTNGKLLDIGCGIGFFLGEAGKRGWETLGIDTATIPLKYARDTLRLHVIQKDFNTFQSKTKYDVIVIMQLIEHLVDPYPLLNKVNQLLTDNGIACFATPNIESVLFKVLKDKFTYLIPPEHVVYYGPDTLKRLLEKTGFTVVKTITYSYPENFGAIYRFLREKQQDTKSNIVTSTPLKNQIKIKNWKHLFFEDVIRKYGYRLLNIRLHGSMVEMYAKKSISS